MVENKPISISKSVRSLNLVTASARLVGCLSKVYWLPLKSCRHSCSAGYPVNFTEAMPLILLMPSPKLVPSKLFPFYRHVDRCILDHAAVLALAIWRLLCLGGFRREFLNWVVRRAISERGGRGVPCSNKICSREGVECNCG